MTFTRGDSFLFKFQRKNINNEIILTKSQKMWFTVKEDYETKDILIQKSLDNGIEFANDGYYHIEIRPNDTRNLDYGIYVCDIQIESKKN